MYSLPFNTVLLTISQLDVISRNNFIQFKRYNLLFRKQMILKNQKQHVLYLSNCEHEL